MDLIECGTECTCSLYFSSLVNQNGVTVFSERIRPSGRLKHRWEVNIKVYLKLIGWEEGHGLI